MNTVLRGGSINEVSDTRKASKNVSPKFSKNLKLLLFLSVSAGLSENLPQNVTASKILSP